VIVLSNIKSNPDLLNKVSLLILIKTLTSPLIVSFNTLPLSLKMIISVSSIPQGIVTLIVSFSNTLFPFSMIHLSTSNGIIFSVKSCDKLIVIVLIIGIGFCNMYILS